MSNQRMIVSFPSLFSLILFLSSGIPSSQVDAQACFYPNGSPSKQDDRPCSSEPGSACCPLNWQCLSNGLCFLENEGYYGRYTCTDPSWESDGCPQLCTQDNTATGNEAIQRCSGNNYCCDANRPTPGCCETTDDRFQLQVGNVIASIGSDSPTGVAPVISSNRPGTTLIPQQPVSSTSPRSSTATPEPISPSVSSSSASEAVPSSSTVGSTATQGIAVASSSLITSDFSVRSSTSPPSSNQASNTQPITVVLTSIITNPSGGSSTLTSTFLTTDTLPSAAPASTTSTSSDPTSAPSPSNRNLGAIIGPAVAVPLAVLALAGFAFFIWRRHQSKKRAAQAIAAEQSNYPYTGMAEMNSPASIWMPHSPERTDRTAGIEVM